MGITGKYEEFRYVDFIFTVDSWCRAFCTNRAFITAVARSTTILAGETMAVTWSNNILDLSHLVSAAIRCKS